MQSPFSSITYTTRGTRNTNDQVIAWQEEKERARCWKITQIVSFRNIASKTINI